MQTVAKPRKKPKPPAPIFAAPFDPNKAQPRAYVPHDTYQRGDGDVIAPVRPGGMDFMKWPSIGDSC